MVHLLLSASLLLAAADLPITGRADPALAPLDELMTSFVEEHGATGAALAVTRGGKLVYARGFGYADRENDKPVQPDSRFRIASISKPITAVAILHLVEKNKLRLDDRIVDLIGAQAVTDGKDPKPKLPGRRKLPLELTPLEGTIDPRWGEITVLDCLRHTGGWDRDKSFDPMFRSVAIAKALQSPPPASAEQVMRYMLTQPLDFDPHARYAYSNFGYCLLGRVIEQVTGRPYEEYVRREILAPLGIRRMQIGKTLETLPDEVRYYDERDKTGPAVIGDDIGTPVPHPYGAWYLEAMDAHGGWIASATDLVRFASALDDPERCPILGPAAIDMLFTRPDGLAGHDEAGKPKEVYYGCGWSVRPTSKGKQNTWHGGSLPGTSTILVRREADQTCWAVLFNTRYGTSKRPLAGTIDPLVHQAVNAVKSWPEIDLFEKKVR